MSDKGTPKYFQIPEPGQIVEVRRRRWIAGQIQSSAISDNLSSKQHLVTLSSLDEDSLGEEIQVVWELEPGAQIIEKAGLPKITGWDSAERLEAFLDAVRWGAVTNADRSFLQAPFRSGITIEDYQLDPLVRAVDMARVNLLIADDVGLGKTIEAGLVIQELLVRHRARTVFIVCPAPLQLKWQTEMQEKFGLEFRIVDAEYVRQLRRERGIHANPWTSFPRLISSMDWMKTGEGLRLLKDILPPNFSYPRKFDILVVDEAHNVAPAAATKYALESQRTKLIRMLAPHFSNRLFLSATPHNGYQESFTSLLELLDDQRFAKTVMPDEKQLQRVMVRRLKQDIVDAEGKPVFPIRQLEGLEVDYSEEEQNAHKLLKYYIEDRSKSVKGTQSEFGSDFVHKLLKKRLFSSPLAFANTLAKHRQSLGKKGIKSTKNIIDERILRKAILISEELQANDENLEVVQHEAVELVGETTVPLSEVQLGILEKLTNWAENAKYQVDSKAKAIINWLERHLKVNSKWNNKRVILFTEYRATHTWLEQILVSHGYGGERLMVLHGGTSSEDREIIKAAFQADPNISPVRILLATDAASEGIDLQNHCNYLIHIEIPWNPNVMEQRNGRIDRHGQKEEKVLIWHPVGKGFDKSKLSESDNAGDHEYLMRAVIKIDQIREDLGSVGPVIAQQIEEVMLGRRKSFDTSYVEKRAASARRLVSTERKLRERITRLHERLMEAKSDFRLNSDNIAQAVIVALELAEKPTLIPISLPGVPEGKVFEVPLLSGSWGRATAGLEHPHTRTRRPITFDHDVGKGRDDIVLVHLNHKLVQMSLRLLREELWKLDDIKLLHRVVVRVVPSEMLDDPAVALWSRLVITGGNHHRLHEEITISGGEFKHSGFSRIPQISRLESMLGVSIPIDPSEALFGALKDRFERHEAAIISAVEARSRERLNFLKSSLARRKEGEKDDVMTVLNELEQSILEELKDQGPQQLELDLWPDEQRNQLKLDIEALRARLLRIPDEKKNEVSIIESKYSKIEDRTFPVAVVFLIPQTYIGKGTFK